MGILTCIHRYLIPIYSFINVIQIVNYYIHALVSFYNVFVLINVIQIVNYDVHTVSFYNVFVHI